MVAIVEIELVMLEIRLTFAPQGLMVLCVFTLSNDISLANVTHYPKCRNTEIMSK